MTSKLQSTIAETKFLSSSKGSPDERAFALANGMMRLYDAGIYLFQESLKTGQFRLKIRTIMLLHKEAYFGVDTEAGTLRPGPVKIANSSHAPPVASLLPILLEEMCDYVNDNWNLRNAVHLAAYVLWRLLWIHPFEEGNGTVARALSYVVLMIRLGQRVPGRKTIPEQIASNRFDYYVALEAADAAWADGKLDVSALENLIETMLEIQLTS